jgi:gamma-glutamylaminecyclotransferase
MPHLFVYGTLMRAGANHDVLARLGARFVGTAATRERRTLLELGPYPALVDPTGSDPSPVVGEVFELAEEALEPLDAFEGCPELYGRRKIAVDLDVEHATRPREVEAFTYVLVAPPPPHARVIPGGRYVGTGAALPNGASWEQIAKG